MIKIFRQNYEISRTAEVQIARLQ